METVFGAVDIGGNKIAVGLVTEHGELLDAVQWKSDPSIEAREAILPIAEKLTQMADQHQVKLTKVGCGVTGPVDFHRGILGKNAFFPKWAGNILLTTLIHELHLPVFAENDAIAAAMGEYRWGAGKGSRTFIFVSVGTGIGVSVIIDGKPYRGVDGAHPECGHMVIDMQSNTEPCFCGARGCWEALASGTAMEKRWQKEHGQQLKTKEICELAHSGNQEALKAIEAEGNYLGIGIANLVTLFTPEVITLGGGVMGSYDLFLPYIEEQVARQCGLVPQELVEIKSAQFKERAGLLGAAAILST